MPKVVTQTTSINDTVTEILSLGGTTFPVSIPKAPSYSFGTGTSTGGTVASVVDDHFEKVYTLAAGASVTLVLSALVDDQNRAVAFARVRKFHVWVTARTGNDALMMGGAATAPVTSLTGGATQTHPVYDDELKVANNPAGFAIAAGSADQLKFNNSGSASMTFTVAITGCST